MDLCKIYTAKLVASGSRWPMSSPMNNSLKCTFKTLQVFTYISKSAVLAICRVSQGYLQLAYTQNELYESPKSPSPGQHKAVQKTLWTFVKNCLWYLSPSKWLATVSSPPSIWWQRRGAYNCWTFLVLHRLTLKFKVAANVLFTMTCPRFSIPCEDNKIIFSVSQNDPSTFCSNSDGSFESRTFVRREVLATPIRIKIRVHVNASKAQESYMLRQH